MLSAEVVAAICTHMNDDHGAESLEIVRVLGGVPDAVNARVVSVDVDGVDFDVLSPAGGQTVRLPWGARITERAQVRAEVVALYARATGGNPPAH